MYTIKQEQQNEIAIGQLICAEQLDSYVTDRTRPSRIPDRYPEILIFISSRANKTRSTSLE